MTRKEREDRLAQYELPGFAAGLVHMHLETALLFLERGHLEGAKRQILEAMKDVRDWQRYAQLVTDYPYRREE